MLYPLEFAAVLSAARQHNTTAHVLVAMLGRLGLWVTGAGNARIDDLRYAGGYDLLRVVGKGAKRAEIRCPFRFCVRSRRRPRAGAEGRSCSRRTGRA